MIEIIHHGSAYNPKVAAHFVCPFCGCEFLIPLDEVQTSWAFKITKDTDGEISTNYYKVAKQKCPECDEDYSYELPIDYDKEKSD